MGLFNDNSQNDNLGPSKSSTERGPPGPRGLRGLKGPKGQPGVGFKLTDEGNYNIDGKRLTNVGEPIGDNDATTKAYFESENSKKADKTYVDSEISKVKVHSSPNYHLQQSFTFYKDYGGKQN